MERIKAYLSTKKGGRLLALCAFGAAVFLVAAMGAFCYPPLGGQSMELKPPESLYTVQAGQDRVCLNTAPPEELMVLRGIGEARAAAIVEERLRRGGFTAIEEIMEIKGIGEKTFEAIREYICLS